MARAREAIRILACCLTVSWAGCVSAQNLSEQDAYDIAKDAYVYGVSLGHIGGVHAAGHQLSRPRISAPRFSMSVPVGPRLGSI